MDYYIKYFDKKYLSNPLNNSSANLSKIVSYNKQLVALSEQHSEKIANLIKEMSNDYKFKIYATDIDENMLSKARLGKYTKIELRSTENKYINKYFKKVNDEYIVLDNVKQNVNFRKHDMILDTYDTDFDLIVCRNVVIYFKDETEN